MTADIRTQLQTTLGAAYTVERELGGGGMSRVFVATDTRLGRRVVVKVLAPDLVASVSAERFEREIRLAARLQHPHIVPLLSAGDVNGIPYYTMPFVEGASLRERLALGALPPAEVQSILRDVARALAYAHRQGIVHRDIKPENVLLAEGVAMVADFGVARALSAATTLAGDVLTQVGMQIGTPAYMAPEQAAGDPDVDFRADLYAFGVMAYELLAGQHPFAGKRNMHALVAAHLTEQPKPLTTHTTDVATSLSTIVMQCLGKDPAERPDSASAIVRALETVSTPNAVATPATPVTPPAAKAVPGIAVLPFTNMSGDPENEYFSDGITDDLIGALTSLKGLRVAARTSSFAFKGRNVELATVGSTLGVRTVLQGSVRRAGNRVRVTVQLMNAAEGTQLWSERYDRNLDDIFAIQDEIVRGIVDQLKVTLGLEQTVAAQLVAPQTDDLEAYQLCLRGREAAYMRSPASLRRAIEYFRQALGRDPDYARAHLGLAEAHIGLGVYQYIPTIEANNVATSALQAAERLRPDLALVHVLAGQLKLYLRSDWHEAGPDFERALAIDPNEPLAHAYIAFLNGMLGNLEASKTAALRAVSLDPLSVFVRAVSVMGFPVVGIPGADSAAALDAHETALAMDPNAVIHLWMAATRLGDFGRHEEAVARMRRAVELTQRGPLIVGMYARALALAGRREEALALRAELRDRAQREYVGPAAMLMMVGLDLNDEAATSSLLEANIEGKTGPTAIVTTVVRELTPLLDHPTLGPLVRRLTLWATRPASSPSSPTPAVA
jgi:serine/threonine protein kinase/tetratricopeptide (TPR) repeat protein